MGKGAAGGPCLGLSTALIEIRPVGSEAYAREELIAELGAAFTCPQLGIATEPRRDHAPYMASRLKVLRILHDLRSSEQRAGCD